MIMIPLPFFRPSASHSSSMALWIDFILRLPHFRELSDLLGDGHGQSGGPRPTHLDDLCLFC